MKDELKAKVVCIVGLLIGGALTQAQTNSIYVAGLECSGTLSVANSIVIGPVTICATNGVVTIRDGVTLDAASREFWKAVQKAYPAMFPRRPQVAGHEIVDGVEFCRRYNCPVCNLPKVEVVK